MGSWFLTLATCKCWQWLIHWIEPFWIHWNIFLERCHKYIKVEIVSAYLLEEDQRCEPEGCILPFSTLFLVHLLWKQKSSSFQCNDFLSMDRHDSAYREQAPPRLWSSMNQLACVCLCDFLFLWMGISSSYMWRSRLLSMYVHIKENTPYLNISETLHIIKEQRQYNTWIVVENSLAGHANAIIIVISDAISDFHRLEISLHFYYWYQIFKKCYLEPQYAWYIVDKKTMAPYKHHFMHWK